MPGVSDVSVKVGLDTTQMAAGARKASNEVRGIEKSMEPANMSLRQMRREAQRTFQDTRTPLERYHREVQKLTTLHQRGLISQETYRRAVERTAKTYRDSAAAASKANAMTRTIRDSIKGLATSMLAYVGPVLLFQKAIHALGDSFTEIDKLAKTSARLGVPVQALREMHHAAKLSGVEVRTFDIALQRMTRRVAEAGMGTGEARDAIRELGLDAGKLAKMTPDQMLMAVAGAMENVKGQSDRVRLSFKLFDSEGVAIVQMLGAGEEGLRAMAQEARALGGEIDEFDASKVEAANDAMTKLALSWGRAKEQAAIRVAPLVKNLADWSTAMSHTQGSAYDLASAVVHLDKQAALKAFDQWTTGLIALGGASDEAAKRQKELADQAAMVKESLEKQGSAIEQAQKTLDDLRRTNEQFNWSDQAKQADQFRRALAQAGVDPATIKDMTAAYKEQLTVQEKLRKAAEAEKASPMGQFRERSAKATEGLADYVKDLQQQLRLGGREMTSYQRQVEEFIATTYPDNPFGAEAARQKLRPLVDELEKIDQRAKDLQAGQALRDQFARPAEEAAAKIADVRRLLSVGAIDLQTARRAATAAMTPQIEAAGEMTGPHIKARGSEAAARAILRHEIGGERRDTQTKRLTEILAQLQRIAQNTNPQNKQPGVTTKPYAER